MLTLCRQIGGAVMLALAVPGGLIVRSALFSCFPASRYGSQDSEQLIVSEKTTEPSSFVVLLRALVMLVFLVGLPGVAVLKGSFPELADRLAERGREVLASVSDHVSEARGVDTLPAGATGQTAAGDYTSPQIQSPAPHQSTGPLPSIGPPTPRHVDTLVADPMEHDHGHVLIPNAATGSLPLAGPRQPPSPVVPLDPGRAEKMVGDLRQLGATFYRLEKWGDQGQLFRFQCKMSVGGNPHVNRHFEATDADANRAIEHVVQHVQTWRETASQ